MSRDETERIRQQLRRNNPAHAPEKLVREYEADQQAEVDQAASKTSLTPDDTGCFIVTTCNGTRHLFDLDRSEYVRDPSERSRSKYVVDGELVDLGGFAGDGHRLSMTSVEHWPTIGASFFIWLGSEWRRSSTVVSIEPAHDEPAPASVPPVDPRKFKQRLEEVMRERGQTSYVEWDETTQQVVVHHLDGAKNEVDQP